MSRVAERYEHDGTPRITKTISTNKNNDWDKMRRFLYRATSSSSSSADRCLTLSQVDKVLIFLEGLFPDNPTLQRSILQSSPRILSRNVKTKLQPTADFLRSLYGDELFVEALNRNPDLLLTAGTGYKGCELDLVEVYLREELRLRPAKINKLKKSAPALFQTSMVKLLSTVSFLEEILLAATKNGNDTTTTTHSPEKVAVNTIRKLVESHPRIFQLSVEENLRPRIQYLQNRCHLQDSDLASLLKNSGAGILLGLSVRDNLQPTLDLLSELLLLQEDRSVQRLRRVLLSHPQILGLSLENLRAKISYFDAIDRLSQDGTTTTTH